MLQHTLILSEVFIIRKNTVTINVIREPSRIKI